MGIREDLPEIAGYLDEIDSFLQGCDGESGEQVFADAFNPESETYAQLQRTWVLRDKIKLAISNHPLSHDAQKSFIEDVERNLETSYRWIKINSWEAPILPSGVMREWFNTRIFSEGSTLDETMFYSCFHPALFDLASERWKCNPRVAIEKSGFGGATETNDTREQDLKKHGIPADLSSWFWTVDCLNLTAIALQRLGIEYKLSDYVEWTCTGEPPNLNMGEIFSKPDLYFEAVFGKRITDNDDFTRLEGVKIWKTPKSTFVSPLWEYLSWSSDSRYGELGEYARTAGDIGEGIDAAVVCSDAEHDPDDTHRLRLTPTHIFHAGVAMMRLKIKIEFDDDIRRGRSEKITIEKRTKASGQRSTQAKEKRRAALFEKMSSLAIRNPDIAKHLGPEDVAKLALKECIAENPAMWRQGKGQVGDYLSKIFCGDAGPEMQARFKELFGSKALKRSRGFRHTP